MCHGVTYWRLQRRSTAQACKSDILNLQVNYIQCDCLVYTLGLNPAVVF